ncbi:MAG: hypothetical protein ACI9V9_000150, partial [Oleispira sp.]
NSMFANQSKTVNLLHPLVPQVPLFLHPPGALSLVPQLLQLILIFSIY